MIDEKRLIEIITEEIYKVLNSPNQNCKEEFEANKTIKSGVSFKDLKALEALKEATPARIGIGRAGCRLPTKELISLRRDHAIAKDAVLRAVDPKVLEELNLFQVVTQCDDIDVHLTRPDLGRQFSQETKAIILEKCIKNPSVQIYVSDGLSSTSINANIADILPAMIDQLNYLKIDVGTPFFVKYGRVPAMDVVTELLGSQVTCVLIGERPGLATAESMSAYITYGGSVGMAEAGRTVISNIHRGGIPPVEAGAYIVDVIGKMLKEKKSGVDLKL